MDFATILGVLIGSILIVLSILINGTAFGAYFNIPSLIMVMGGSFAAMVVSLPATQITKFFQYFTIALRTGNQQEGVLVGDLVNASDRARREGLLTLEDLIEQINDEFMRKGIQLVVDGTDPEIIKSILYTDLNYLQERHDVGINFFKLWGKIAPAFGLIGTLIGLVAMLANLEDRSSIGTGLALALLTTFYGAIFANLILLPIQNKLENRSKEEVRTKEIIIEGILSIQSGDNPRVLLEKLLSFFPPDQRVSVRQEAEGIK